MQPTRILHADCAEAMREMDEASVDAVVCDPPYGLEFMGKEWDRLDTAHAKRDRADELEVESKRPFLAHSVAYQTGAVAQQWHHAWATEALRVLKPGGHLLAFGGTRTYHRLACAVEDAGFEVRDCLAWMYGSGFPKSLDVSKAIDRAAGVEREDVYEDTERVMDNHVLGLGLGVGVVERRPVTESAQRWNGWGTALKPAYEPIVLARKPLVGTVAANVERYGTGAVNVDGCRVEMSSQDAETIRNAGGFMKAGWDKPATPVYNANSADNPMPTIDAAPHTLGRWPANVLLDEQAAEMVDEQSGELTSNSGTPFNRSDKTGTAAFGDFAGVPAAGYYGDTGGASRFYYTAKASRAERNAGLEGFEERVSSKLGAGLVSSVGASAEIHGLAPGTTSSEDRVARNHHPTVKPIDLMRWLCRLVTPPGGTVLDPFTGSGTTGVACVLEGFRFIGIEREREYVDIAEARIAFWTEHGEKALLAMYEAERRRGVEEAGQLALDGVW